MSDNMKSILMQWLAALALLLVTHVSQAAITCSSITSTGFSTAYSSTGPVPNSTQASFTVTCVRTLAGDPTTLSYTVGANNGLNFSGGSNNAKLASLIKYDTYKDSACTTSWKASGGNRITDSMTLSGLVPTQKTTTYYGCITISGQSVPAGTYTDLVTMDLSVSSVVNTFPVSISTPATCTIGSSPGNVAFSYTSFSAIAATASTTFGVTCTNSLPYTMAVNPASGTLVGISYSLSVPASSTGTGVQQTQTISGTAAAGQAGTCATGTCSGTQATTLTITY